MTKRKSLGAPVPGFADGRPVPARPGENEASRLLRQSWAACFLADDATPHDAGRRVLDDLAAFCNATATTAKAAPDGVADPLASAIAEGRRQVWLLLAVRLGLKLKGY